MNIKNVTNNWLILRYTDLLDNLGKLNFESSQCGQIIEIYILRVDNRHMKNRYKPALLIKLSSPDSLELSSSSVVPRSADSAPD